MRAGPSGYRPLQAGRGGTTARRAFLATAGVFRPMRKRLRRETGALVASFSHAPGLGVKRIAGQLARLIDRIPHGTRIHLVGHSLGGLVARWYVQEMRGHSDIRVTRSYVDVSSPLAADAAARMGRALFSQN